MRFGASQYGAADIRPTDEASHKVGLAFYTDGTQDTTINPTEKLRITSGGKVGIGTNDPLGTLALIADDQQAQADIVFQTKGGTSLAHAALSTTDDSGGTDVMLGANLYLSTNGTQTRYNTGRSGSAVQFGYSGTIRFYNNSSNNAPTERLRITSGGKVNIGGDYTSITSTLRVLGDSNAGSQTYLEKNSGSTNNTYNSVLTLSSRSTGSAAAIYGPAIGFQHAFGGSNYAGCLIASQCNSDVNTADLVFYPRK